MADGEIRYESKEIRALRGAEAMTIAKWQKDGWELIGQEQGPLLQTKLTFRRPKPKPPLRLLAAAGAVGVILAIVIAIGAIREGGSAAASPSAPQTEAAAAPSGQPADAPSPEAAPIEATASSGPSEIDEILTVQNNAELAAILGEGDYCSSTIADFATRYRGRTIEFDGSIGAMNNHGSYETRYDILIGAGDYSTTSASGPAFQFRDVNVFDLRLSGETIPDAIGKGDNLHLVAKVQEFESKSCLFQLEPVSTRFR